MSKNSISKTIDNNYNVFQSIANTIHHITSLPVSIWAPDENKTALKIVASVGLPASYVQTASLDLKKPSVTGEAYNTKKIQVAKNISTDPRWYYKGQAREMNWKSAICVPIEVDGASIGTISVYGYTERSISDLRHILPDFSKQIALTLEVGKQKEVLQQILDIDAKLQSMSESPKNILQAIVKGACDITGAHCAVVYPFDADHDEFYDSENISFYGLQKKLKVSEKPRSKEGMASYIRQKGEVALANIEAEEPAMLATSPFIKREKIRAFMGIALKVGKDILGVLYVNYRIPHKFMKQEKNTIRLFSNQASYALHNARLYQKAATQIGALERLHEVGTTLMSVPNTSESLRNTLERIAQSARHVLGADLVELYQYFQSQDRYDLPPVQFGNRHDKTVPKTAIYKDDVIYKIVKNRQSEYIIDAQNSKTLIIPFTVKRVDAPKKRFVIRENVKSTAAIPLIVSDEIVGVVFANYRTFQSFSSEQKKLIELFAHQAAIAIWNARLFTSMQKRLGERLNDISVFQEIYEKMYSANQEELMSLIAEKSAQLTGAKYGVLWLADKDRTQLTCVGVAGDDRPASALPKLSLDKKSINGLVMRTSKPYLCDDIKKDLHYKDWYEDARSELAVPLLHNNNVLGTLDVESTSVGNFTDDHVELLKTLANQAAIVIQNSRTIKKLDTLDDVGQALTSTIRLREQEILDLIYKEASDLMDTNNMYIALYDEQTDIVRFGLAFVNGRRIDIERGKGWQPRKGGQGRTEEIIRTRHSILTTTYAEAIEWYAQPGRKEYTKLRLFPSWIGVPMVAGDKVLGVIATYHPKREYVYNIDDLDILRSMANQAAIAIDNSRMFYDVNQRLSTLVTFEQEVTSAIHSGENKILELVYEQVSHLMNTQNFYIALYDERTDIIRFGLMFKDGTRIDMPSRKAGKGKTEVIIATQKPLFHPTHAESKAWYDMPEHKEYAGIQSSSWLGVPMIVRGKTIGVIATYHLETEYLYDGNDLEFLQAMADQAAIAIEAARSFSDVQNRIEDLETVNIIAQAISTKVGASDLLQTIVSQLREHLNCTHCAIFFPEETGKETFLVSKYTDGDYAQEIKSRKFKLGKGVAGWCFDHGEAVLLNDAATDPRFEKARARGYDPRSLLVVPVKEGDNVIGVISADHNRANGFDEGDLRLMETVAGHVGIALNKSDLYNDLQARIEELTGLQNISKALTSEDNLERLLSKVVQTAKQVLDADIVTVYQYDSDTEEFYLPVVIGSGKQSMPGENGVVSQILKNGKIILAENSLADPLLGKSNFVRKQNVESCAAVPLIYSGRLTGIIFINYIKPHHFSHYDEMVINIFADQAATAINMAGNLYNTNQQLETIQSVFNAVELHTGLREFLQSILEKMLERTNARNGTIQLYDPKRNELVMWAKVGNVVNHRYETISLDSGLTGKAAKEKSSVYIPNTKDSSEYIGYISETQSEFAVPMLIGDTLIGVLNAEDPAPFAFSPYSRKLIERLASQLAILTRQKLIAQEVEEKKLTDQVNYNMGLVTAEVAHKVGNAAGKIRIITRENLVDSTNLTDSQQEDVQVILRNVEEMIEATEELFRPYGAENKADITIKEMIRVAVGQCAIPANVSVSANLDAKLPKVHVEVTKVQSYLAELLNNAIKYTKKGMINNNATRGTIEIVSQRGEDGYIEILFTNHGPSIPASRWESIFKVFSVDEKRPKEEQSYGLGLWGARATMQKQGGDVILRESDDKKTTFVVRLPLS